MKRIPRYPQVSATLLGQLAVASSHRGQGLGGILLFDALDRAYRSTREISSPMVVTDPLDEEATAFYSRYGFQRLEGLERMFLMMKTIKKLIDLA